MKAVMSTAAASISASGRSNFSEACLRNLSREASNKVDLGLAGGTSITRAMSTMKAEQEARRSLRRATKLLPTSSCMISTWIEVGGHGPGPGWSGPFEGSVPCWERPQFYQLRYRSCLRVTHPS